MSVFDYVIVGGGSAGCVLASKLSESGKYTVALIEAGPDDRSPLIHMPKGFGKLLGDPRHVWYFPTEPEAATDHKSQLWLRGKMLGGSSGVNGMVYVRCHPADYDGWQAMGLRGWSWSTMAPYFRGMEHHSLGAAEHRGSGGRLRVSSHPERHRLGDAILEAGRTVGLPVREDLNHPEQLGIGYITYNIWRGRRQSAAVAFLDATVRRRSNLSIFTDMLVQRVLLDGIKATGVLVRSGDREQTITACREVILSAGAINSPKLLQLSGIGPADQLRSLGVDVRVDSPEVGSNMSEHLLTWQQFWLRHKRDSRNGAYSGLPLVLNTLRYALRRRGPLSTGSSDLAVFFKTRPELDRPDAQINIDNYSLNLDSPAMDFDARPGMQLYAYGLRPESRGSVMARSANPDDPPLIRTNYLSADADRQTLVGAFRFARRLMAQPALTALIDGEKTPGLGVQSDDEIIDVYRKRGQAGYHAMGTCRMGIDAGAVLDERLRVRGAASLRVVDLSVVPAPLSGNTNGPTMAIAARAADLILDDAAHVQ